MRILTILVAAASVLCARALNNEGKLSRIPLDVTADGHPQPSWWLASTSERSNEWKKEELGLEHAIIELYKLQDETPLKQSERHVLSTDSSGRFALPASLNGDYLLKVSHRAFRFPQVMVTAEGQGDYTYTVVESGAGIKHVVRRLPSLTLRPERLDAPYPPPQPINIFAYLKNPMVIMILISLFASFVLPRMVNQEEMQAAAGEIPQLSTSFTTKAKEMKAN